MKSILAFSLIALTAICSQAATIKWGGTGQAYYGSTRLTSGGTAYLVYLGENQSNWSGFDYANDFEGSRLQSKSTAPLGAIGAANSFTATEGSALGGIDSVSDKLTDGKSSFGVLFTTTQDGKDYYYLGDVFTFDTTSGNYNGTTKIFTATSTVSPNASAQWSEAIPEPATGALALAGVALLFKRRRA